METEDTRLSLVFAISFVRFDAAMSFILRNLVNEIGTLDEKKLLRVYLLIHTRAKDLTIGLGQVQVLGLGAARSKTRLLITYPSPPSRYSVTSLLRQSDPLEAMRADLGITVPEKSKYSRIFAKRGTEIPEDDIQLIQDLIQERQKDLQDAIVDNVLEMLHSNGLLLLEKREDDVINEHDQKKINELSGKLILSKIDLANISERDRQIVDMCREMKSSIEIGRVVHLAPKSVDNRLSELRGIFGEDVVPRRR